MSYTCYFYIKLYRNNVVGSGKTVAIRIEESSTKPSYRLDTAVLEYSVETSGMVELSIFDINGRLVSTLYSGELSSGNYTASWDASEQPSGLYIAQLTSGSTIQTTKLLLLK